MIPKFLAPEVFPYSSVEIVRVPAPTVSGNGGLAVRRRRWGVVEVALEPVPAEQADPVVDVEPEPLDPDDADREDDQAGDACTRACGYCGRCS